MLRISRRLPAFRAPLQRGFPRASLRRGVPPPRLLSCVVVSVTVVGMALAAPGSAQDPGFTARPLEAGHWSYGLLEVLHARGLPAAWPVWLEPLPAGSLHEAMATAADGVSGGDHAVAAWTRALATETGLSPGQWGRLGVAAGFERTDVSLLPERGLYLEGTGEVALSPGVALWATGSLNTEGETGELSSGGLAARLGAAQVLVGRISPRIGQGTSTILLAGRNAMEGVLVGTARPFRIPLLGRTTAHLFIAPWVDTPTVDRAWFSSLGVSIEPHPAVTLGAYRTVRFAGEGLSQGLADALWSLVPLQGGDDPAEDNQGELAARVRFKAWGQPLATYVSLGFEDPQSLWEDPGLVAGILIPWNVGGGVLATRYEYQAFGSAARWCGPCTASSHRWYSQREYGPYQTEDVLIGSSLGGYGSRHQVRVTYWSAATLRLGGVVFVERREEENLLFERWPGSRTGIGVSAAVRPRPGWEIQLRAAVADSDGGAESGLDLSFRIFDAIRNPAGAMR